MSAATATRVAPEWRVSDSPVPYAESLAAMEARVAAIRAGTAPELVWLLEHPPTYTAGTSATEGGLVDPRFPVFRTGRGGQWTYHGPGQRTGYVLLDLNARGRDIRAYVHGLEEWVIRALDRFNVRGARGGPGREGVWVEDPATGGRAKVAALGVRVTRWVTWHGVAVNLEPDLSHYAGIVPCGIRDAGVTSLWRLGVTATMAELDGALMGAWGEVFG